MSLPLEGDRKIIYSIFAQRHVLLWADSFEFDILLLLMKLCNTFNSVECINTQNLLSYLLKTENLLRPSKFPHAVMAQTLHLVFWVPTCSNDTVNTPCLLSSHMQQWCSHHTLGEIFISSCSFSFISQPPPPVLPTDLEICLNWWAGKRKWRPLRIDNSLYWNIILFPLSPLLQGK